MDVKEAIKDLEEMKSIEYRPEHKTEVINVVLSELEKKEAIINLMAKQLVEAHGWFYSEFDNFTEKDWIEYFRKKVAEINVGDIPEQN